MMSRRAYSIRCILLLFLLLSCRPTAGPATHTPGPAVGRASFEEAVQVGNTQFMEEHLPYIEADRQDAYFWIDISEVRQEGIWPIPWR
jgi:hypothetical protein